MSQALLEAPTDWYSSSDYLVTPRTPAAQMPMSRNSHSTLTHAGAEWTAGA